MNKTKKLQRIGISTIVTFFLSLGLFLNVQAQQGEVSGTVVAADDGTSLPGVNILPKSPI